MVKPKDAATVGAFFMEGLIDSGDYSDLLAAWGQGCIELVEEMTQYADLTWALAEEGARIADGFPGVFDYEVSTCFGRWFATHVRDYGHEPSGEKCLEYIQNECVDFFMQGLDDKILRRWLVDAFERVIDNWKTPREET